MFENLYTTKMSRSKERLESRFAKIRSKNGKLSRLMAVIIFLAILIVIAAVSICIAVSRTKIYTPDERYGQIYQRALAEGDSLIENSVTNWQVNGEDAKAVLKIMEPNLKQKFVNEFSGDRYEVLICKINSQNLTTMDGLFIFDDITGELMYQASGTNLETDRFPAIYNLLDRIDKDFEMSDLTGMQEVELVVKDKSYTLLNAEDLAVAEKMLSAAKPMSGGSKCPFKARLIITDKNGERSKIILAIDGCAVFQDGDAYYDYSDGTNEKFFAMFGTKPDELVDLYYVW